MSQDGDTPTHIESKSADIPKRQTTLTRGSKVQAKFKNGKRWFNGEIQRENRDGTYEVLFDDGDRDLAVPHENIKSQDVQAPIQSTSSHAAVLTRGTKVEARFKNGKRWFKGEIQRENRDGSYEVLFDDGDRDLAVPRENIKVAGGGTAE